VYDTKPEGINNTGVDLNNQIVTISVNNISGQGDGNIEGIG
jgi:hypothetical protein